MPSSGIVSPLARIRMTTSSTSPCVGIVATRNSISSPPERLNFILPSCGSLFTVISRLDMILIREITANAEPDFHIFFANIGFNMYIRSPSRISIINNFIDKLHDYTIRFRDHVAVFIFYCFVFIVESSQKFRKRVYILGRMEKEVDEFDDVFSQGHIVFYLFSFQKVFNDISF